MANKRQSDVYEEYAMEALVHSEGDVPVQLSMALALRSLAYAVLAVKATLEEHERTRQFEQRTR